MLNLRAMSTTPRRYGDFGVPEYWVADPMAGEVLVWRFDAGAVEPEPFVGPFEWRPDHRVEPLLLDPADLFRPL